MGLGSVSLLNVFVLFGFLKTPIHPANPSLQSPFSVRPAQRIPEVNGSHLYFILVPSTVFCITYSPVLPFIFLLLHWAEPLKGRDIAVSFLCPHTKTC